MVRTTNIQASQKREELPSHDNVNGLRPLNGADEVDNADTAGVNTRNITKSTSHVQDGPITGNL